MRAEPSEASGPRRRLLSGRVWLLVAAAVVIVGLVSLRVLAVLYTDFLWFHYQGLTSLWSGVLGAKLFLGTVFVAAFLGGMWGNLAIVDRCAPELSSLGAEDDLVRRWRTLTGRHPVLLRTVVALILALLVGIGAASHWQQWILFRHAVPFGVKDPEFHMDVGFFVFQLPFYQFLVNWTFLALAVMFAVSAIAHFLSGGIRLQRPGRRVTPQVKAHLSLLLALIALVKAAGYYLQRFQLDTSTRGYGEGAFYTDVHATLPALTLLVFVSLVAMVIFVVNLRRQGFILPILGLGLWALVSVVVGAIYPAAVQAFSVQPAQSTKELPYIVRNISATRAAMGVNVVTTQPFSGTGNVTSVGATDQASLGSIRLWDPSFAQTTYDKLQDLHSYYQLTGLSVNRYPLDGQTTPVVIGVRQIDGSELPAQSWVNVHLQYTHGYGAVLSPANEVGSDGNPEFVIGNLPPYSSHGAPVLTQPAVYFGLATPGSPNYVVAGSKQPEVDYQQTNGTNVTSTYKGSGGVPAGSFLRRAAFAVRFGDLSLLLSHLVTPDSRLMWVRDVPDMVHKAAPFLALDSNPYPVVLDGQIYWEIDAYTTTDEYPYAQQAATSALSSTSGLDTSFNYARNSVKVLVNAYNGRMTFYAWDTQDPILRAYMKAFPHLFTPRSQMSPTLLSQLRYPQDLFTVQAKTLGRYHITNPKAFYNATDAWDLSQDPGANLSGSGGGASTDGAGSADDSPGVTRMNPIYQVNSLPGSSSLQFDLLEPFVPGAGKGQSGSQAQNLTGFLVALSDPSDYGRLELYVTPSGELIDGPAMVNSMINANHTISSEITLLDSHGSQAELGSVMMVPVGQSLLYVRPLYVSSTQNPLPQVQEVIVVDGKQIAMQPTLSAALAQVIGQQVPGLSAAAAAGASPATSPTSSQAASLVQQADAALQQAQTDLSNQNLGAYEKDVQQAAQDLQQAAQLSTGSGSGG
jgi:uncharacterized membrane protein (UPF0182 family)